MPHRQRPPDEPPHRRHDDLPEIEASLATADDPELVRQLLKEYQNKVLQEIVTGALDKWLDKRYAAFGRWTVAGVCVSLFGAFAYAYLHTGGFK